MSGGVGPVRFAGFGLVLDYGSYGCIYILVLGRFRFFRSVMVFGFFVASFFSSRFGFDFLKTAVFGFRFLKLNTVFHYYRVPGHTIGGYRPQKCVYVKVNDWSESETRSD